MSGVKCLNVLFAGLGSIGVRHLEHLSQLCAEQGIELCVTALRATERPLPEKAVPLVHRQIRAGSHCFTPKQCFDIAFITGPTHLHAGSIALLNNHTKAFFIEKPIFEHPDYNLQSLGLDGNRIAHVAAPMRHTLLYTALRARLAKLRPYSVRVICSSYLPAWRPGADYRKGYSAKREEGGGAALDLIHEWDYIVGLFGFPQKVYSMRGHFSRLDITSDDLAVYIAKYPGFLCEVHLDYFGREYRRSAEFFCEDGVLRADWGTGRLHLPDGTALDFAEPPYGGHRREMERFLDCITQKNQKISGCADAGENSPAHALKILEMVLGEHLWQQECL